MTTRTPSPPKWLSPYAQEEWKRVAGSLFKRGLLTDETQGLFEARFEGGFGNRRHTP